MTPAERVARFRRLLAQKVVPIDRFRQVVFAEGVPEQSKGTDRNLRAITWKLLLNYLPPDRAQWQAVLAEQRRSYGNFCQELTVDPGGASAG